MLHLTALPPLALYIHFPWCVRKCPYCDFNSHRLAAGVPEEAYLAALLRDLEAQLPSVWGRPVQSIFIGGGTPSLMSPEMLEALLSQLRALLPLMPDAEVTLEANPGTAEQGRFRAFREAGVNRLSLGIQSFDSGMLERLGRIHDGAEAVHAVEAAHGAGIDNINLDLMFGLPGQSLEQAAADVAQAVSLSPTHLSYYQLTIEPNTPFAHTPPVLPEEEALWAIQQQGQERLDAAGYGQYEVSAYALAGRQCRHNLNYWRFGDYLGIGAGAHGKVTLPAEGRIERQWKVRHPEAYIESDAAAMVAGRCDIPRDDLPFEFMMNALRLTHGFETALFAERTGLPLTVSEAALKRAERLGLIDWQPLQITPTARGRDHLNALLQLFLPEER